MKAIFKILLWLVGVFIALLLVGFFLPKTSHIERTATIHAKPESVYGLLNNLSSYDKWMPWNQLDPNWKVEYASQTQGTGAWYKWNSSNKQVGNGKLTIDESVPNTKVVTKMEFADFAEPSFGGWEIKPEGENTSLKWYMNSNMGNNPFYRWMGLFMDKMVGAQFDTGLANIKKLADKGELAIKIIQEPTYTIEEITVSKKIIVYVSDSAANEAEIGKKFMQIIPGELGGFLKKSGLKMAGPPMAWYNGPGAPFIFDIGVAVDKQPAATEGRIKVRELVAGKAVVAHFFGPYDLTGKAYTAVGEWIKQHNKTAIGPPYELYIGDPGIEKDAYKVQTDIVFPVK